MTQARGREPVVEMPWWAAFGIVIPFCLVGGVLWQFGQAELAWGVFGGSGGVVVLPIAAAVLGRCKVSVFAMGVFGATTVLCGTAVVAALLGTDLVEEAGLNVRRYQIGVIGSALFGLMAETFAAVMVLRPTWDLAHSAGSPDGEAWKSAPNGPTTEPKPTDGPPPSEG